MKVKVKECDVKDIKFNLKSCCVEGLIGSWLGVLMGCWLVVGLVACVDVLVGLVSSWLGCCVVGVLLCVLLGL